MTLIDLLLLILATSALVDIWFKAEFFADQRDLVETYATLPKRPWWARLLHCDYCLSHHVAFWVVILWFTSKYLHEPWATYSQIPLWVLAVVRGSIILNGLLPARMRHKQFLFSEDDDERPDATDGSDT